MDKTEIELRAELKALHRTNRIIKELPSTLKGDKYWCGKIFPSAYKEALKDESQKKDEIVTINEIFKSEVHFKKYFDKKPKKKENLDFIKRDISEGKCVTWSTLRDHHDRKKHRSTFKRVIRDPFEKNRWVIETLCSKRDGNHSRCLKLCKDMEKFL